MRFDPDEALTRVAGNRGILARVISKFLETSAKTLAGLVEAVQQADAPTAARHGHSLKGAALNLAAGEVAELAARVEELARADNLDQAAVVLARLQEAMSSLETELRAYMGGQ